MHAVGKFFPRSDRAPAIEPVAERLLRTLITNAMPRAEVRRGERIASGFYTSHALEVVP
jgi:magnesium-protoporphyrin O-methyltransferase